MFVCGWAWKGWARMESGITVSHPILVCVQFFPVPPSSSQLSAGCPAIQLNSDAAYEDSISFHVLRASYYKTAPSPHLRLQPQVQVITCASDQWVVDRRFHDTLLSSINLLEQLTELGETFTY